MSPFIDQGKKSKTKEYYREYYNNNKEKELAKGKRWRLNNKEKIKKSRNKYYGREIPARNRCPVCNCFLDKFQKCNNNHLNRKCQICKKFLNKSGICSGNHTRKDIFKGICKNCGKEYVGRGKDFCSNLCNGNFMSGKNHPLWNNGSSFEPYGIDFNNILKEQIRKRDNYTCQECNYNQEQLKRKLTIHHIDYNKKNNNPDNLISLCSSCHTKTNFGRNKWIEYYQKKVISLAT